MRGCVGSRVAAAIAGSVLLLAAAAALVPEAAAGTPTLRHAGRWMTDSRGRTVVLHGVAIMDFGPKHLPAVQGFSSDDAAFLAAHGFNVARVGFNWSGVEPEPGVIDHAYVASIVNTVRQLGAHRIWSVLDLHQDGWGPAVNGQDGAPAWATLTNGLPNPPLPFGANYFGNPALERAFDNFWANAAGPGGVGLQDRYAAMMAQLASAMRGAPYVLGYEVMNEPWPGSQYSTCMNPDGCAAFDSQQLTAFYRRVIPAVHRVDPRRMVFYEPNLFFDFGAATNLQNPAPRDRLTGFTFHDYCLAAGAGSALPVLPESGESCPVEEDMTLGNAERYSQSTGAALLNTEWSATADLDTVLRMASELDTYRMSNTYWQYCCAGNNATLVADARKPPRPPNLHNAVLTRIERPYPRVVAGTPTPWVWDPPSRSFTFAYPTRLPGGGKGTGMATEIYVPRLHFGSGYAVAFTGAAVTSSPTSGVLALCAPRGSKWVAVRITRDRGGATDPPRGHGSCGRSTPDRLSATPNSLAVTISHRGGLIALERSLTVRIPASRRRCRSLMTVRIHPASGAQVVAATLRIKRRLLRLNLHGRGLFHVKLRLPFGHIRTELLARARVNRRVSTLRIVRTYQGCRR